MNTEELIKYPKRINQELEGVRRKDRQEFCGLKNGSIQPMDIDAIDVIGDHFDVYGFKTRNAFYVNGYSTGEKITSFTFTEFQKRCGKDGLYIQAAHETRPYESIRYDKAYVMRVWKGREKVLEKEYGELAVADFRKMRHGEDPEPLLSMNYGFQGKHGGFLLGLYDSDEWEMRNAEKLTKLLNEMGLESFLMDMMKTSPSEKGSVLTADVMVDRMLFTQWYERKETVKDIQEKFWKHYLSKPNAEFENLKWDIMKNF